MHKYIMIGPQGAGKGTQSKLLSEKFGFVHISIGEIFRWNVSNHTKLGSRVTRITSEGRLVSDDVVERVVQDRLEMHDWRYGFVLDGFPRTPAQAMYLFENWNLDRAIYLDLDESTGYERVMARVQPERVAASRSARMTIPRRCVKGYGNITRRPGRCWTCSRSATCCSELTAGSQSRKCSMRSWTGSGSAKAR